MGLVGEEGGRRVRSDLARGEGRGATHPFAFLVALAYAVPPTTSFNSLPLRSPPT